MRGELYIFNSGAWINNRGVGIAYISCVRSSQEESLDLTVDVSLSGTTLNLETGIYLSDGSLVQGFGSINFQIEKIDDAKSYLDKYLFQIETNELVVYSNTVYRSIS